jgi:hypothetical protein
MTTEERLEDLESEFAHAKRRSRKLLILAVVALTVGGLSLAWAIVGTRLLARAQGVGSVANQIRANSFLLVDEKGNARGGMFMVKDGPAFALTDEKNVPRAMVTVLKDGPSFELDDENRKTRSRWNLLGDGPGLGMLDENGTVRVLLRVDKDGETLAFLDEKGMPRANLYSSLALGLGMGLLDENGTNRASLRVERDGATLGLADEKGNTRAALGVTKTISRDGKATTYPESSLLFFGPDSKVIWQAPR